MKESELKAAVLGAARRMNALGINRGRAGNVSARWDHGFVVTPTGMAGDECTAADMVFMGLDGKARPGRTPSSEWRFHRDIYVARPEAGAVVHSHAPFATALACMETGIEPFHYMVARFGGRDVRCAAYATFGTQALSDAAVAALKDRSAALLAHHGMICHAADLDKVLALAIEVETLARIYLQALPVAEPPLLPAEEMAEVLNRFKDYKP